MEKIKVFVSYSWDSPEHKAWVKKLADTLEEIQEVHVTWDGYDLDSLVDKNYFMEAGIHDADLVLVIATSKYKAKADGRLGGVGLETFMGSALHWDGLLRDKKSKLVVVLREPDSTPRYLQGHFHLDFRNDADFPSRMGELLDLLRGKSTAARPKKRRSLTAPSEISYEFTRVEELIRVNHPNRRVIVNALDGTDFSGANRIKYELWETKSPALNYFLALHANVNIQQTARHAGARLLAAGIRPLEMTVLRHRGGRPEQDLIASALTEAKLPTRVYECTYKEYIWDYCIDETLKAIDPPNPIENYTNQDLTFVNSEGEEVRVDSALEHFLQVLQKPSNVSAHLVVAPGGMGKTSLCLSVAKALHFREDLRSSVILIQAEAIKKYVSERGVPPSRIESIYDIYELYAKYQNHGKLFERSTFDLAVVCGNLTVIIDGLDELSSLFQGQFDVGSFLESLKQLHDQLGSSNVLLTTRHNVVDQIADLEALAIERYELLGFDTESCKRYVTRRLQGYASGSAMIERVMAQVAKIRIQDDDGRIIPFLADISTTVAEDSLAEGKNGGFDVSDDSTPYPSNNDLTDHIVHSILRREQTRHDLEIQIADVVELISDLVIDYGKRWPIAQMQERLSLLYETRAQSVLAKLVLNPLLVLQNGDVELRYSFLSSYFEVLLMLRGLLRSSLESGTMRALSRLDPESEEARDLKRYFLSHSAEVEAALHSIVPLLRDQATSSNSSADDARGRREYAKGAIASLLNLYFSAQKLSVDSTTAKLLSFYGLKEDTNEIRTLEGLFIKGTFPPIDFSRLIVTKSGFHGYKNFLACRFVDVKFMYSVFDQCADLSLTRSDLDPSMIDATCDPGDLQDAFVLAKASKDTEQAMVNQEVTKFLHSFFKGDRFVDNKCAHIKFSTKVPGLASDKFDRLVANGYIAHTKAKTVADFYEIAPGFKASVRRFLTDGYPDGKLKKFIALLR